MFSIKRKTIIMASLVVLLVVAGYLNVRFSDKTGDGTQASNTGTGNGGIVLSQTKDGDGSASVNANAGESGGDAASVSANYYANFKTERETSRNQQIEYLDGIIADSNTDAETLKQAQNQKLTLTQSMEKEVTVEGLLKAKGFEDVVVTIHEGSINVVVKDGDLTDAKVAQILDIVCRETKEAPENVKIIPKT
ncbi:SpoIIIAH-like family protein [Gehongia tenuis]|uniref:SpoIIIAH-like family protein n=1 Tax=Gehongia tenuis TaxID=2763655 RepID=A0A926D4M0_9FIRM|nr:SpoIIIAH-like family protein [Gehongia tenuis]MBC8531161.1 SpoIIIAH-like family protein [Gehongia tenuis]